MLLPKRCGRCALLVRGRRFCVYRAAACGHAALRKHHRKISAGRGDHTPPANKRNGFRKPLRGAMPTSPRAIYGNAIIIRRAGHPKGARFALLHRVHPAPTTTKRNAYRGAKYPPQQRKETVRGKDGLFSKGERGNSERIEWYQSKGSFRSRPQKNRATVPGPVWLPMVVPT